MGLGYCAMPEYQRRQHCTHLIDLNVSGVKVSVTQESFNCISVHDMICVRDGAQLAASWP